MRYEIWWVEENGDEFYTGDFFFSHDEAMEIINELNYVEDGNRVYIVKKVNFIRKKA